MLAQTQVGRVAGRFREFTARFPTPASCADATVGEVVRAWVGLGYNRRALALHSAAEAIVRDHDGRVPATLADLEALAGVGPYTARAVLAFAFNADVAAVDTNVGRVLARAGLGRQIRPGKVQALADRLVPVRSAREWNLALMDFGSLVCTSRQPACARCPVRAAGACVWRSGETDGPDPAVGSARVASRPSRFEGSDRQGRGRLVRAVCAGPIATTTSSGPPAGRGKPRAPDASPTHSSPRGSSYAVHPGSCRSPDRSRDRVGLLPGTVGASDCLA